MIKSPAKAKDKLIVALDTSSLEEARKMVDDLKDVAGMFKMGLELFSEAGTEIFDLIEEKNIKVFFDCKFKDIPNTVARASANVVKNKVAMFNLHADGGFEMMKAARIAVEEEANKLNVAKPALIAVTVLTSLSEQELKEELSVNIAITDQVKKLALLAKEAGLDGVVASAREAKLIREAAGDDFLIVTPGIRPKWASKDDQSRIVTPKDALNQGSSYLVVGRPITKAGNKVEAARKVVKEMEEASAKA